MENNLEVIDFWSGQLLEIQTSDQDPFFTQIIRHDETNIFVQRPVNKKNYSMFITNETPVTVYFHDNKQGLLSFESTIHPGQNNRLAVIKKPSTHAIKKAQRRRFFRVQAGVEMGLILPSSGKSNEAEYMDLLTHDISGGGLSFLYPYRLAETGDFVEGYLHLKSKTFQKKVAFKGKILNMIKQPNEFIRFSLKFIQMNESVRSDIIKYCMLKQIELRKKLNHFPAE